MSLKPAKVMSTPPQSLAHRFLNCSSSLQCWLTSNPIRICSLLSYRCRGCRRVSARDGGQGGLEPEYLLVTCFDQPGLTPQNNCAGWETSRLVLGHSWEEMYLLLCASFVIRAPGFGGT